MGVTLRLIYIVGMVSLVGGVWSGWCLFMCLFNYDAWGVASSSFMWVWHWVGSIVGVVLFVGGVWYE